MFKLPKDLTIAHIDACKSELMKFIDANDSLAIDDSDICRIDTIGVQFLLAIITYIVAQNKELIWHASSEVLKQSIIQLGVKDPMLEQYLN